jgi:YD repeat-containing protein
VGWYNAAHLPEKLSYGNGVVADPNYNARLQLESLAYTKGSRKTGKTGGMTTLMDLTYHYTAPNGGNNGQIQAITEIQGQLAATTSFTYDAWSRLKTAENPGGANPPFNLSWEYDRFGNRRKQSGNPGLSVELSFDERRNWVTAIAAVSTEHDGAGNLIKDDQQSYVYDAESRISEVKDPSGTNTLASYSYDGSGLRVKKEAGGQSTVYVFSSTKVIAEYVNGALSTEYVHSGSQLLATIEGGTIKYHHADHLSVRLSTDATANVIRRFGHYPFGETWYETGTR